MIPSALRPGLRSLLLASALFPLPALAQNAGSGPAAAIEDVVVTAQRREESVQKTPVSVTALTTQTLDERQIQNVTDLSGQVPNLTVESVTGVGNAARIFLRGVGEDQAQFNVDAAVGVYIDGVYYARTNGALFDFFDIERIEVLRGPQGVLYGRNTPGGAINIITRRPTDHLTGQGEIVAGSYGRFDVRAALSGPLVPGRLAGSISGLVKTRDGTSYNPVQDRDINRRDVAAVRGSLLFTPTDQWDVLLSYDRIDDDSDAFTPTSIIAGVPSDIFETQAGTPPDASFLANGYSLNAAYKVDDRLTVRSITAYRDLEQTGRLDNDAEARVISENAFAARQHQFSQELTASLDLERMQVVVGAYYFDEHNQHDAYIFSGSRANPAQAVTVTPDFSIQDTESYALFGQATFTVTPVLNLTVGGRYTWDSKSFSNRYPTRDLLYRASKDWSAFTPRVAIDYSLNDRVLLFASYGEGYKAGGFNRSAVAVTATTPFDEERVSSYEAGIKSDWLGRRLRLNLTAFHNDYEDLQLSTFDPATNVTRRFNAAAATIRGLELEANAVPLPGLNLYATLGYLDAGYDAFVDRVDGTLQDVSDRDLKGAPRLRYTLGVAWSPDLEIPGKIRIGGERSHRSRVYNNVANTEDIATPELELYNGFLSYESADGRWTVSLTGKNLGDERYYSNGIYIAGLLNSVYPAEPRTWWVGLRYAL